MALEHVLSLLWSRRYMFEFMIEYSKPANLLDVPKYLANSIISTYKEPGQIRTITRVLKIMYDRIYDKQLYGNTYRKSTRDGAVICLRTLYTDKFRHVAITNVECCKYAPNVKTIEPSHGFIFRIENDLWRVVWDKTFPVNPDYNWDTGRLFRESSSDELCSMSCRCMVMCCVVATIIFV